MFEAIGEIIGKKMKSKEGAKIVKEIGAIVGKVVEVAIRL